MLSKKRNGWLWVVMLFAVCAVVYGMLSSYPRELAVYSDELRALAEDTLDVEKIELVTDGERCPVYYIELK